MRNGIAASMPSSMMELARLLSCIGFGLNLHTQASSCYAHYGNKPLPEYSLFDHSSRGLVGQEAKAVSDGRRLSCWRSLTRKLFIPVLSFS